MKKILASLAILVLSANLSLHSQALGLSAYAIGMFPKLDMPEYIPYYNTPRTLTQATKFSPGVRIEANYILPGFSFPVTGFNGLGYTYFLPVTDSTVVNAHFKNSGGNISVAGTRKITNSVISIRFGYEIPQTFDDFLLIHFGMGMGYGKWKYTNILPEKTTSFNYDQSDFDESDFEPVKVRSAHLEILFGGVYELEHFSITGQYSVMFPFGGGRDKVLHFGHGLNVGIFIPLKRF